jgi:hypothetical protein
LIVRLAQLLKEKGFQGDRLLLRLLRERLGSHEQHEDGHQAFHH